jgi:hypothetical protein
MCHRYTSLSLHEDLPQEVLVRPLRLVVGVRGLHTNQMWIEQIRQNGKTNWKWKVRNYRPKAPQRAHGEMVARVMAPWQGLVRVEGDDRPTNRKPLVAPMLKKKRTTEKDQLYRTTLQHPRAQAPVRARKNRVAPTDLGHVMQGRVGDPPSVGDQVPHHRVTLRTTEQHEPKQPQ